VIIHDLEVVISIGYRVKFSQSVQFRLSCAWVWGETATIGGRLSINSSEVQLHRFNILLRPV